MGEPIRARTAALASIEPWEGTLVARVYERGARGIEMTAIRAGRAAYVVSELSPLLGDEFTAHRVRRRATGKTRLHGKV